MLRGRRWTFRSGLGSGRNTGMVKLTPLLIPAILFLFLVFTVNVQQTKAADCDCGYCHGDNHHGDGWTGCSGCHDSPPQTGTHLVHYNSAPLPSLKYSDTTVSSTADAYKFGCGNCHPLDRAQHNNGTVNVELYNPAAPSGSLKAMNPSNAAYTPGPQATTYAHKIAGQPDFSYSNGTCSNVYCHSGFVVTSSGPVGNPLTYPAGPVPPGYKLNIVGVTNYIMDNTCSNVTYAPYNVNTGREYKITPAWGTNSDGLHTTFSTCSECHQFPLITNYTTVQAGVGDSHYWYNQYGYAYGHANNMEYFSGIPCATCHFGTADHRNGIPPANPPTTNIPTTWQNVNGTWLQIYSPVPLKSRVMHVNGTPDVGFDTVNGYRYYYNNPYYGIYNTLFSLNSATYEPGTKTCSNVSCHYNGNPMADPSLWQQNVKWGSPYRGWEGPGTECDQCHRMGYLNETCTPAP